MDIGDYIYVDAITDINDNIIKFINKVNQDTKCDIPYEINRDDTIQCIKVKDLFRGREAEWKINPKFIQPLNDKIEYRID